MKLYIQFRVFSSKVLAILLMLIAVLSFLAMKSIFLSALLIIAGLLCSSSRFYLLGFSKDRAISTLEATLNLLSIAFRGTEEGIHLQTKDVLFQCFSLGPLSLFRVKFGDEVMKEGRAIEAVMVKRLKS